MKIICDTREQSPLDFSRYEAVVEPGALEVGDYAPAGLGHLCAVERKSVPDLVASLTKGAWTVRARAYAGPGGLDAFAVVIEGSLGQVRRHEYRSQAKPHALLQSMCAFSVRYSVTWVWADDPAGAAYFTFHFMRHFIREAEARYRGDHQSAWRDSPACPAIGAPTMPRKTKKTPAPKPAVEPRPMTKAETERYEAFKERRQATPLAVKLWKGPTGRQALRKTFPLVQKTHCQGLRVPWIPWTRIFAKRLLNQVANSSTMGGLETPAHVNAIAAAMTGLAPQSELEGMLAAQMTACHNAAMECLRRACVKDQTFEGRKMNMTFADRFMRTFAVQVEALGKHRKGGQQKVVVEHVHVYPGGKPRRQHQPDYPGVGDKHGTGESIPCQQAIAAQPDAVPLRLGDGQEMLLPVPADGQALPATRHGER